MIQIDKNQKKTDQAWRRLYDRLNNDGLIPVKAHRSMVRPALLKWGVSAAAVLALCLYISISFFTEGKHIPKKDLLTQQNKEESTLVTTLEDGSIVYLAGNASLQYPKHFASEKREVSLQGNALFDIAGNRSRPFLIETEQVKVEVLGTAFNIKTNKQTPFELSVQRGAVKVTLKKSGQIAFVKTGETVTLLKQQLQLSHTSDPELFNQYTKRIHFKDECLANILRVINLQKSGIRLQTSLELGNRKLTVSFSGDSPETMVELICMALNLKYSREKDTLTITE